MVIDAGELKRDELLTGIKRHADNTVKSKFGTEWRDVLSKQLVDDRRKKIYRNGNWVWLGKRSDRIRESANCRDGMTDEASRVLLNRAISDKTG